VSPTGDRIRSDAPGAREAGQSAPLPDPAALRASLGNDAASLAAGLSALAQARADRFDPARFRFVEALLERSGRMPPRLAGPLVSKARSALVHYLDAYLVAREEAAAVMAGRGAGPEDGVRRLCVLFEAGDFRGVTRLAGRGVRRPGPLAGLARDVLRGNREDVADAGTSFEEELRRQERAVVQSVAGGSMHDGVQGGGAENGAGELRALRQVRRSAVRRMADRRVVHAIEDAPANPGPLNASALIARSLHAMRAISPGYANRLVACMDALLWLEQAGADMGPGKSPNPRRRKS
jgi:hypothetical protein